MSKPTTEGSLVEILSLVANYFLVILAICNLVFVLFYYRRNYVFVWQVWKRFRLRMFLEVSALLAFVIAMALALSQVPGLNYGWLNLLGGSGSGSGNMLIKPIAEWSESPHLLVRLITPVFLLGFLVAIPFLANAEEVMFRRGNHTWRSIAKWSVLFGLCHCLVGVSLAVGIALIISGLFFGYQYKRAFVRCFDSAKALSPSDHGIRSTGNAIDICQGIQPPTENWEQEAEKEAVMVSTTYHAMYNTILLVVLLLLAVVAI